jgi:hypothetical protein
MVDNYIVFGVRFSSWTGRDKASGRAFHGPVGTSRLVWFKKPISGRAKAKIQRKQHLTSSPLLGAIGGSHPTPDDDEDEELPDPKPMDIASDQDADPHPIEEEYKEGTQHLHTLNVQASRNPYDGQSSQHKSHKQKEQNFPTNQMGGILDNETIYFLLQEPGLSHIERARISENMSDRALIHNWIGGRMDRKYSPFSTQTQLDHQHIQAILRNETLADIMAEIRLRIWMLETNTPRVVVEMVCSWIGIIANLVKKKKFVQ